MTAENESKLETDQLAESFQVAAWVHLLGGLVNRYKPFWIRMGNWETGFLAEEISETGIHQPVYVAGLARSGSTLLLELLNRHPHLSAHRYSDYPMLFTPYWWNRYLTLTPQKQKVLKERTHRDGILVSPESPEAFEEILWMAFFPDQHDPQHSSVLDEGTDKPAFELFYRDHIRKLLFVRGGRRYLAKGNYNLVRLSYLLKLFPDARFVIPIRDPAHHIASLINQHRRFCKGQQLVPRARAHLTRVGHFEFGLDRRPINTGQPDRVAQIAELWKNGAEVEGWAHYWAMIHDFLADQLSRPGLRQAIRLIEHETLCRSAREEVAALFEHCRLPTDELKMEEITGMIRPPASAAPKIFDAGELALIDRITAGSAGRLGMGLHTGIG